MTFSLIAMDSERNFMVVASATKTEAVGASVPAILPGFGGVVSQAFTNPALRELTLTGLEQGLSAEAALHSALATDPDPQLRQLATMDSSGVAAFHSGSGCTPYFAEQIAENFICIGNLLKNEGVIPGMAAAWRPANSLVELVEHSFACLVAAEKAGGDARGRQSAALIVARMVEAPAIIQQIRIDDSPNPLAKLREQIDQWLPTRAPLA